VFIFEKPALRRLVRIPGSHFRACPSSTDRVGVGFGERDEEAGGGAGCFVAVQLPVGQATTVDIAASFESRVEGGVLQARVRTLPGVAAS